MGHIDLNDLNVYSRSFARLVFTAFPKWRRYAQLGDDPLDTPGSMQLSIPSPRFGSDLPLNVGTRCEGITIWWGKWHEHFGDWIGQDREEGFGAVLSFLQELVSDQIAILDRWQDGSVVRNITIRRSDLPGPVEDGWTLRTWSGRYDVGFFDWDRG